jgi:arginine decarboxylase
MPTLTSKAMQQMNDWTLQNARDTYNLPYWSSDYVDVNAQGHLEVRPTRDGSRPGVDLFEVAQRVKQHGLNWPVLVRFIDILHDRVDTLCGAFAEVIREEAYRGRYTAVYPIKVNQHRSVVESILGHGGERVGLEAGSKPELMAVLALSPMQGGVIVCNGYKDREYVRLALIGRRLGHRVYIVIEKPSELALVLEESAQLGIKPLLGMRVRLASIGAGKWQNTGGEKSKFGLSAAQAIQVIERLRASDRVDCLQLLHFHLGSQIANIRDIQAGMREIARYYAELHALGVGINVVDVGGGLGVDYEGTRSRSYCSMNYSVQEYAHAVVHALRDICDQLALPNPDIITESGRALTAHHAVLITNVTDIEAVPDPQDLQQPREDQPSILHDLWHGLQHVSQKSVLEVYHDAVHALSEVHSMYTHGVLTLAQRAWAEQVYFAICRRVRPLLQANQRTQREIFDELNDKMADKYFCNFSVFQSMPDVWAIDQIFPVVPLHRLNEAPERRGVIQDLTCDSDGHIEHYVDNEGIETTLPLHSYDPSQPYLIGMFMIGAYQEILGDMHNLFGDTDSVNLTMTSGGGYSLSRPQRGDTVEAVLRYVHFEAAELAQAYRAKVMANETLSQNERKTYLAELEAGLVGYTYLED